MPVTPTYPGVYIEEIPSGVRTITGVATSITAFVGRAERGPTNDAVEINSWGDFERRFGGLADGFPMGFAVRDFYQNGGGRAVIVRLIHSAEGEDAPKEATLTLPDNLKLKAVSVGSWGDSLRARIDYEGITEETAKRFAPLTKDDLFNLTVQDMKTGALERFINVTVKNTPDTPRLLSHVLKAESNLVQVDTLSPAKPKETDTGVDAAVDADTSVPVAKREEVKAKARVIPPFSREDKYRTVGVTDKGVDGGQLGKNDVYAGDGMQDNKQGLYALNKVDLFNLLCIPPEVEEKDWYGDGVYAAAMKYCQEKRAMLIVDPPSAWSSNKDTAAATAKAEIANLGLSGEAARNAALYFPRVIQSNPRRDGQLGTFPPSGLVAGVMARTDTTRGVWKAPAGLDAAINGVRSLEINLNDAENGMLNPLGINCLRFFPASGRVVWGARTLRGNDQLADEYKYIPVRRTALYIEESLYRGLKWVVFEPNDEPLWAQIRLNAGAFMHNLFRQGAFQGASPREAYFVKCDKETTTQNDINLGIVNIVVGFAPLKPAEFVIVKLQQIAGQIEV